MLALKSSLLNTKYTTINIPKVTASIIFIYNLKVTFEDYTAVF